MAAPGLELQGAFVAALRGSTEVMALVHGVYDGMGFGKTRKAQGAPWGSAGGYISFGPESSVPDDLDCLELEEITLQLDVWSKQPGRVHCKRICAAVRRALKGVVLDLPTHGHVRTSLVLERVLPDPQAGVTHGVMQFSAEIEVAQ